MLNGQRPYDHQCACMWCERQLDHLQLQFTPPAGSLWALSVRTPTRFAGGGALFVAPQPNYPAAALLAHELTVRASHDHKQTLLTATAPKTPHTCLYTHTSPAHQRNQLLLLPQRTPPQIWLTCLLLPACMPQLALCCLQPADCWSTAAAVHAWMPFALQQQQSSK